MISNSFSYKGVIAIVCIFNLVGSDNQIYESPDSNKMSEEVFNLIKDELQLFNMKLTKSFIVDHVRKKRSMYNHEITPTLDNDGYDIDLGYLDSKKNAIPLVTMNDEFLLIADNVTYKLTSLSQASNPDIDFHSHLGSTLVEHGNSIAVLPVSNWHLSQGEIILCNIHWRRTNFFLVATKDRTFSQIYTTTGTKFEEPILRQQIKNHGQATSAKFFVHNFNLYLIIANDNHLHSLTLCPLFRWEGTYMDEIHNIQTRGTKEITTFDIDYVTYIVLAQSEDTTGNSEIGTQVIKMNDNEELEKVQLLWSNTPVAVVYMPGFKEHFIIIGQKREYSICYWFGGFDFVYWQKLETLTGDHIYFDILPVKETTILLAGNATSLKFYIPTASAESIPRIMPQEFTFSVPPGQEILAAKFLVFPNDNYHVAIQIANQNRIRLLVRKVKIQIRQIGESQTRDDDNKLSICLETVKTLLDDSENLITPINTLSPLVLTKDTPLDYKGVLVSKSNVVIHTKHSVINTTWIKPPVSALDSGLLPHKLLEATADVNKLFHQNNKKLSDVLRKTHPNNITGDITFSNLRVENFKSYGSNIELEYLNEMRSNAIRHDVLRKVTNASQTVKGVWWTKNLSLKTFKTSHWNSEIEANTKKFLQLQCHEGLNEIVGSEYHFSNMTFAQDLKINEMFSINNVPFSNIVFRSKNNCRVKDYKISESIYGIEKFRPLYINGVLFSEWMDETIKLQAERIQNVSGSTFLNTFTTRNLDVGSVNNLHWDPFTKSVLLKNSNSPQTIDSSVECPNLYIGDADIGKINEMAIKEMMTNSDQQNINSHIKVRDLHITNDNQRVNNINGYPFSKYAILDKVMNISSPAILENVQCENIFTTGGVTIGGKDIYHMANLRKKLIIDTRNESFYISKDAIAQSVYTDSINGVLLKDIPQSLWSTRRNNIVHSLDLSSHGVNVVQMFQTGKLNQMSIPQDFVSTERDTLINSSIVFTKTATVNRQVTLAENARLNDNSQSLSSFEQNIVRKGSGKTISGYKHFKDNVLATSDLTLMTINGMDLNNVVLLNDPRNYHFTGTKVFQSISVADLLSYANIDVSNSVNQHYNLKHVADNTVTLFPNQPIHIYSDVTFNQTINASDMTVSEINGMHFTADTIQNLALLKKKNHFNEFIISGIVIFETNSEVMQLNNLFLQEYLAQVSRINLPQVIRNHKEFTNVECNNLLCSTINSIDLTKLNSFGLSTTRNQDIGSIFTFSNAKISANLNNSHFSGIPIAYFALNRQGNQVLINSDVKIRSGIAPSKNFIKGNINNYNINKVATQLDLFSDYREFGHVYVLGNVHWRTDSNSMNSLSYLRDHALRGQTPQIITKRMFFKKDLAIQSVTIKDWIGGINLQYIEMDSKWGTNQMVFRGQTNLFHKGFMVDNGFKANRSTFETVDNIPFKDFFENLVLNNSSYPSPSAPILGNKILVGPLTIGNLQTNGTNIFTEMVPVDYQGKLHSANFQHAELQNMYPDKEFMNQLHKFLENRVDLSNSQNITGKYTFMDLNVANCNIHRINNISNFDLLYTNRSQPQYISEETYVQHLTVKGNVAVPRINNRDLDDLHSNSILTNENATFSRPVVFKKEVNVIRDLHIQNHEDFNRTHYLVEKYTHYLKNSMQNFPATNDAKNAVAHQMSSLIRNSSSPVWLEYLRLQQYWPSSSFKLRVEQFTDHKGKIVLSFYDQRKDYYDIGLPKGCYCQSVEFIQFGETFPYKFDRFDCKNVFLLKGQQNLYGLYSGAVSYNNSCSKANDEKPLLVKFNGDIIPNTMVIEHATNSNYTMPVGYLEIGYLTDAKIFSRKGIDYIIVSQYYNSIEGYHNAPTLVVTLSDGKILKTQLINSSGARRVALGIVNGYQLLAIANSYNPDPSSCESHSKILFWSEKEEQFLLLREIETNQAMDVVFLTITASAKQVDFVAFAQNTDAASSVVDIYQYDSQFKNFQIYQTITTECEVESIHTVSISDIHYLIVVTQQTGLLFNEYSFTEGFQQAFTVPIAGATDVAPFLWHSRLYFGISSTNMSLLAEGILPSHLSNIRVPS